MTAGTGISPNDLIDVLSTLGSTVLPGPVTQLDALPKDAHDHPALAAEVRLWGAWCGKVAVCISATLARAVAAQMRGISAAEISDEMALDVVEEIANVSAGSVKALLPAPSEMALPKSIAPAWEGPSGATDSEWIAAYFRVDTGYFLIAVTPGPGRSRARRNRLA
jgi:hypothetical protein